MTRDSIPGTYGEAWPDGPFKASSDILFLRVASDGRTIGQYHESGQAIYDGLSLGPTAGVSPCAFGPDGTVYVSSLDGVRIYNRDGSLLRTLPGYIGSQGIRWVDPSGSIVTGDATYTSPGPLWEWTEIPVGRIGQGEGGVVIRTSDGVLRRVVEASVPARFIRVNQVGSKVAITYSVFSQNTVYRVLTTEDELRSLPPVEVPIDPPKEDPPMPVDSPLATIQTIRAKYPTPLGATHGRFLVELALALGMDLLRKSYGTHVVLPDGTGVSQDVLLDPARIGYDVLSDGEGAARPVWSGPVEGSPFPLERVYRPVGRIEDPPKGEDSLEPLKTRLGAVEREIKASQEHVRVLDNEVGDHAAILEGIDSRLDRLEARVGAVELTPALEYEADCGRKFGHAHPITIRRK